MRDEKSEALGPEELARLAERARRLLGGAGAWLDTAGSGARVRLGGDRRRRAALELPDAVVAMLARDPGLQPRSAGGARLLRTTAPAAAPPAPGRPGVVEGERPGSGPEGGVRPRRVNLGESPLQWLARRPGRDGRPWLSAVELAAGERLRDDAHLAGVVGRLTMGWSSQPRGAGAGSAPGLDPLERGVAARARVRAALDAVGPGLAEILEHACVRETALAAAERELRLPRRAGKAMLKLALGRLAAHYRLL